MRLEEQVYEHPTQASRVRLAVFQQSPPAEPAVTGLAPREPGFLVTEERLGAGKVVATLGYFASLEDAQACLRVRVEALLSQLYRRAPPA